MSMIIGVAGPAGSGKDAVAEMLVERYDFVRIALADPLKRIVMNTWSFEPEQLWGSSERRAETPPGKDRPIAREALQLLGTEWGRKLDQDVWIRLALTHANAVLNGMGYNKLIGLKETFRTRVNGVVIPDARFSNEAQAIRNMNGVVWRVDRPGLSSSGPVGGVKGHASEVGLPSHMVDQIIMNKGTLDDLRDTVDRLMEAR